MPTTKRQPIPRDPETYTKGLSRAAPIFLLRTSAIMLFLAAAFFGEFEQTAILRILAGASTPLRDRLDFYWGEWDFAALTAPAPIFIARGICMIVPVILFMLAVHGLTKAKRWAHQVALALTLILLLLNALFLASKIWYIGSLLSNQSGSAFGKPEPTWASVPLAFPIWMFVLEIILLITLRLLTKLRIDVLH